MDAPPDPAVMPAIPLDCLPQAVLVSDGSGHWSALNQAAGDLLGLKPDAVLTQRIDTPLDLLGEDGQPLSAEAYPWVRTLATGLPCSSVLGVRLPDGSLRWLEALASPLPDGSVFAQCHDHTEQQTLRRLLEARSRIHTVAQGGNLEDVLRATLDEAEALTDSCIGFYHFVEPDQITLSLQAWSTRTAAHYCRAEGKGQHYPVNQAGVWVDAIREGRAVIHNDYASLPHRKGLPEGHAALVREVVVTVQRGGLVQAVLGVGNKARPYTQQDVDLLQELAVLAWEIAEHKRSQEGLHLRDQAMEQSLNAFVLTDGEGLLRHVNPAFLRFWGHASPQEVLGRRRMEFWADPEAALRLATEAGEKGTATGDLLALRADGSTFWAEARLSLVKDEQGHLLAMLGTASDVTEQRRAHREIQEQKEALERFFQASVDLLCLADSSGRLLRVNEAWGRLLGYTVEELEGRFFFDLLHPDDLEPTRRAMEVLAQDQPVIDFVNRYQAKDGTWHHLEWRSVAKAGIISAGARDITQRLKSEMDLRRSTELLRASQRLARVGGWELDLVAGSLYWTEETFRIHDLDPGAPPPTVEEAIGFYIAEHRPVIAAAVLRAREEGLPFDEELQITTALGRRIWVRASGQRTSRQGEAETITGAFQDITLQREASEALRQERDHSNLILETVEAIIVVLDRMGRIALINRKGCEILESPKGALLGMDWFEHCLPQPQGRDVAFPVFQAVMAGETEGLEYFEHEVVTARGQRRLVAWHNSLLRTATGELLGTLSSGEDITERRVAEGALQAMNERLSIISEALTQSPVSVVITDTLGFIEYVNPAFERITGYTAAEVLGRNPRFLKGGTQDAAFYQSLWEQLSGGETWEGRFHNRRKDGSLFWEQARISPVRDASGRIVRYLALKEDITEAIRMTEERHRLEAQLLQAQRLESLGSLAGGVAHDMNNVLMAILGLATALRAGEEAGSVRGRSMDTIISACKKGGQMVRSLLDFARKGTGDRRILDLNALVQDEVDLLARTTLNKVKVVTHLGVGIPGILGDGSALAHALMNLCVNAVDAMDVGGTLTLRTRLDEGGWVVCTVEDTGSGMTPEVMARALEPYFTTKPEGKGTGLGLAMAYGTLQSHGGTLSLASEPGQGTVVTLRLPPAEPPVQEDIPMAEPASGSRGLRVLVVDDDELVRSSTESLLDLLGITTESASCGEEALVRLEAPPPFDLVILDMNMPGLGGAGTLPRLRHMHPDLPVLLATGRADSSAEAVARAYPAVHLLSKPYCLDDLEQAISGRS